ncbi:MAG: hypothetical protein RL757_763 [Bacteroidota bacterium]
MENFFEFYDLPVSFGMDAALLKKKYLINSRKYHPDFHTLASEEQQAEILALSTRNNAAFKTLSDGDLRMAYILELYGLLGDQQQNETMPQDFLMEMMEINEALMELEFDFDKTAFERIKNDINNLQSTIYENIKTDFDAFDNNPDEAERKKNAKKIKNFYLKSRYLLRIQKTLSTFASL